MEEWVGERWHRFITRAADATPMPIHHSPSRRAQGVALRLSQPKAEAPASKASTSLREE